MSQLDPNHEAKRDSLRALGMILAGVGGIFTLIGLVDFFGAFASMRPPTLFWCAFVGLPLLGLGGNLLRVGYLGTAARYVAGEVAPVAKDTVNYLADETRDAVAGVARAAMSGMSARDAGGSVNCPKCNAVNPPDAEFCSNCGADLRHVKHCPACGEENAPDARFCHHCGHQLE